MKYATTIIITSAVMGLTNRAPAGISTHGSSTTYQATGGDWQSMITDDIDASGGLGTDGFYFAGSETAPGVFNGTVQPNSGIFNGVGTLPLYVSSITAGANVVGTAWGVTGYGLIDNPLLTTGADSVSGFWIATGGVAGDPRAVVNFTLSGLASGQTVRVGILAGIEWNTDGRWDPTSIRLTDGVNSAIVGNHTTSPLDANPGGVQAGWAFFDIDANGSYTAFATKRLNTQGAGVAGLTFDSVVVPEPSSLALLALAAPALLLRRRPSKS